jgi:CDK inhibitor PHO81
MLRHESQASDVSVSGLNIPCPSNRKFGKHIQKRQLEIPEYAAHFVDYKALKKVRCSSLLTSMYFIDLPEAYQGPEHDSSATCAK